MSTTSHGIMNIDKVNLDAIPHETFIVDEQGCVLLVNSMWRQRFSSDSEIDTRDLLERLQPETTQRFLSFLENQVGDFRLECEVRQGQGSTGWFVLTAKKWNGVDIGHVWICTLTDVDTQMRNDIRVRERTRAQGEMLDASIDCIKIITPDGRLRHVNEAGRSALGIAPEPDAALDMDWVTLLPPEIHTRARAALDTASNGLSARFPGLSQLPGRPPQYWDNMLTPVIGHDGDVASILCVSRDITKQREAETRLQLAVRASNNAIWDFDLTSGQIVWNDAIEEQFGYVRGEAINSIEWRFERIHPLDRIRVRETLDSALANGDNEFAVEFRFARASGAYVEVLERGGISRDAQGQPVRVVGTLIDQTDRKTVERSLRKANRTLQSTVRKHLLKLSGVWNISHDVLVFASHAGAITQVSPSLEGILGFLPGSVLGRHLSDLAVPADREKLRDAMSKSQGAPIEIRHQHKDGSQQWIEWSFSNIGVEIHAAGRHITSMKDAQVAIEQIEDRFTKLFEISPVPMLLSSDTGSVFRANDAFWKLSGKKSQLFGQDIPLDQIFPERDFIQSALATIAETGSFRSRRSHVRLTSGDLVECLISVEFLFLKEGQCILVAFQDVGARRANEMELMEAINTVMKDASWFSEKIIEKLAQVRDPRRNSGAADLGSLTKREREILELICNGVTDSDISASLNLSRYTIRNHVAALYSKLDIHNRSSLVIWARERGL